MKRNTILKLKKYKKIDNEYLKYINSSFSPEARSYILKGLKEGLDISKYAWYYYSATHMFWIYQGLKKGLDLTNFVDINGYQAEYIYKLYMLNFPIERLKIKSLGWEELNIIYYLVKYHYSNNDINNMLTVLYNRPCSWETLDTVLEKIKNNSNIKKIIRYYYKESF